MSKLKWHTYPQNIKVRLITSFFNRALTSAIMPFMALFFSEHLGVVWAGIFLAATVFVAFISNLIGGYISDRFQRKRVLIITSLISAAMFALMTISLIPLQKWIWLFAACYVFYMMSSSIGKPSMSAIIVDSTTPENRKEVYALDYWLVNLSIAIGTALGGLFYVNHQLELFIGLTIIATCLPIAYAFWLQNSDVKQLKQVHQNVFIDLLANYKIALQDTPFVMVVVGSMCIFAAEFSLNNYIAVRLSKNFETITLGNFDFTGVRMLSSLNIENTLLVVFFTFLITKWMNRFPKKHVLLVGLICYSVGYAILTSSNVWYVLLAMNVLATIGELMYSPIAQTEKANMMPADKRGSYSAFSNLSFSGAELIARSTIIVGAFLFPSMMSVYIGGIALLGTLLLYTALFTVSKKKSNAILHEKSM